MLGWGSDWLHGCSRSLHCEVHSGAGGTFIVGSLGVPGGGSWKFTVGLVEHSCWSCGVWEVHASRKESVKEGKWGLMQGHCT